MRVAVLGATGFIGNKIVDLHLNRNDEVNIFTRNGQYTKIGTKLFIGDIRKPNIALERCLHNVDVLYNCAGEIVDESKMYALHVKGTADLISIAKSRIGKWIQLSSVGAYGNPEEKIVTELTPESPNNIYELTKTISDEYVRNSGIEYNILRPSIVFGSGMPNQSLYTLIKMIKKGFFFFIGKRGFIVNYVHVDDVARALLLLGIERECVNDVFILSQNTSIEKMISAFKSGMQCKRHTIRLPENPVRVISKVLDLFPNPILTSARINNLTNKTIYSSRKIEEQIGFKYINSLEKDLFRFSVENEE